MRIYQRTNITKFPLRLCRVEGGGFLFPFIFLCAYHNLRLFYALAEPKQIHPAPSRADKTERGEDYRSASILPYYLISGKAFYKESDIQQMLEKAYRPLLDNQNLE